MWVYSLPYEGLARLLPFLSVLSKGVVYKLHVPLPLDRLGLIGGAAGGSVLKKQEIRTSFLSERGSDFLVLLG